MTMANSVEARMASLLIALSLFGCSETATCPEGMARRMLPDGTYGAQCESLPDGSSDASTPDAGQGDAGPCGRACMGTTPVCNTETHQCVGCIGSETCGDGTPHCDTAGTMTCVECLSDAHCTTAGMAHCDAGHCVPCEDSTQCTIDGLGLCSAGTCVQCTARDRSACGDNVCDGSTNTCTTRPAHDKGLCQECVADDECMPGQLCVPMTFMDTDVGSFCLWREDATEFGAPNNDCTSVPPYWRGLRVTSIDDTVANVCTLDQTTCVALNQFRTQSCSGPTVGDAQCGAPDVGDGLCRFFSGTSNRCTIPCITDDDCPGVTCNTGVTTRYCNF